MGSHDIYIAHRDVIERALVFVCRRHRLPPVDAEDFSSTCRLHLMDDDYAVIRAYQGRSSLQTYLVTVVTHFFQDWRNARWGKWRPSAEAKRLGPLAVRLETMLLRDGLTLDQAYETLRTNFNLAESRQAVEALAARFPHRTGRTFVSEEAVIEKAAIDSRADAPLKQAEAAAAARQSGAVLAMAVARLAPQDRLVLRMRFEDGCSVADIARALQLEQKPLYRRLERMLGELREALEAAGLTRDTAVGVLDQRGFDLATTGGDDELEIWGEVRPHNRGGFPGTSVRVK